jgi:NAD(P)-dependent dehydrogenase (short-subunit alcohol dehydrogenase family)
LKRVFITGASSGIGAALAAHYAAQGCTLGLLGRRADALQALAASLPNPGLHRCYAADVTDHAALRGAAEAFIGHAGGCDIVIASAGISHGTITELEEDLPVFASIMATNVTSTVATFSPFIRAMRAQGTPARLVGIGSVAGVRGLPGGGAYSASKAAVRVYCESLRVELRGSAIEVVTIAPGYIDTPMTQKNKYAMPFLMQPEAFAAAAARSIARGDSYRVIPWQMGVAARVLAVLPNWLYDLAFAKAPHKARKGGT